MSHGHITRVDKNSIFYNAGAKAAVGSAVFFALQKDLHVIALGLKCAGNDDIHEIVGVRVSKFSEVYYDEAIKPEPALQTIKAAQATETVKASAPEAAADGPPMETIGGSRITDVKDKRITLPNKSQVTYTGKLKVPGDLPHGTGTVTYDHGVSYAGEWNKGKRHGPGKITSKDGYYSEGECEDDLFIGTWTKYNAADNKFLEEQHYDHTTMDTVRRHLGMASRKASAKEAIPEAEVDAAPIEAAGED